MGFYRFLLRLFAITLMAGASAGVWVGFDGPSLGDRNLPGAITDPNADTVAERGDEVASRGGVRLSVACPGQRLQATRELHVCRIEEHRQIVGGEPHGDGR